VNNYTAGTQACQLYNCAAVGDIIGGGILNADYQTQKPNTQLTDGAPLHGAWTDPVKPEQQATVTLETILVMPAGNSPQNNGWPTIVFAHGLGSSKESVFAIAGRLAAAGFATVAIDTSAHGSRAVRISNDINLGCSGMCFSGTTPTGAHCDTITQCNAGETCGSLAANPQLLPPSPTSAPQCYAPFLSPDLATTRDGIRQTVLDHQRVVQALKTCGKDGCAGISVNPSKIYYLGMSLGGIIGTMSAGLSPDIKTAVIDVGGVGWADILENTETLAIRCSLVNGLIDAGILTGEKWTGGSTGLCTTDEWKQQAGYAQFAAIGRWVLDSADGANFAQRLATKRVLLQEVVDDTVVPNVATDNLSKLLGLAPMAADGFNPASPAPSGAIASMGTANKFLKYTSDADNVFVHSSLLRPAPTTEPQDGINGTLRLQVDASTYFLLNNNQ
jgi:pimeloyl-ACP methyl ester carboxylesterase